MFRETSARRRRERRGSRREARFRDGLGFVERIGLRFARRDIGEDGDGALAKGARDGLVGADRLSLDHAGNRNQLAVIGPDVEVKNVLRPDALGALKAQAYVVTAVLVGKFSLHGAADGGLHGARDGIDGDAGNRGQRAVGIDADLGHAGAKIGVDVAEVARLFHGVNDLGRFLFKHGVVRAAQVELDGKTAPGDEIVRGKVLRHGEDIGNRVEFLAQFIHERELAEHSLGFGLQRDVNKRAVNLAIGDRTVRRSESEVNPPMAEKKWSISGC